MTQSAVQMTPARWRQATSVILLIGLGWQTLWLGAAYLASGGREFADDVAPAYLKYVQDPWMLFSDRHQEVFGAAVASPLLPVELTVFHKLFSAAGDFLALRLTMLVHIVAAIGIGFAIAFRSHGAPQGRREWLQAVAISVVPVAWITSVVTVQDDSIASAWAAACLAAFVCCGPVCAAVVAGLGMFFGKIFLALGLVGLWIASPGSRLRITGIAAILMGGLLLFLLWRDHGLAYTQYVYAPYMGASIYGVVSVLVSDFDVFLARDISAVATLVGIAGFVWVACRRRLSFVSAVTGLHFLFLVTYFGAMPEYYAWFLPFLIVTLWSSCRRGLWITFLSGWFSTAFAYGYKLLYGMNSRFPGGKVALKQWYDERIGIDLLGPQIAVALAAVACTLLFALLVLIGDPTSQLRSAEATRSKRATTMRNPSKGPAAPSTSG